MLDIKTLLPELKELASDLAEDLLARATENSEIDAGLRQAFKQIEKGGRTAQAFETWREDYLDQVAVAWVLACVFVRFMEDNHLIDECWLAGEGERRKLAEDTHELFFRAHPHDTDREYFHHVFHEVGKIPAARDLFAEGKTPLWAVGPSGDAAMNLLKFWREIDAETGHLKRSFQVEPGDTRFLGDLYQDLSERARKKYALLQTPVFVEEFILDRTLNPAIDEFGLDKVRLIDPTCGSGHFLLGAFARLFNLWIKRESNEIAAAQKALDGVWGVDINPFAVAIARFRLIVAAVQACGIKRLKRAPAWKIHLATGDSLLFGSRWTRTGEKVLERQWLASDEENWAPEIYACEDKEAIEEVLCQQYHAVVGNPPYITVKDASLNEAYRGRYTTCHRQYSLAVPFTERFFDLCTTSNDGRTGYVGMITANSFMKREFGKKLIEEFLPQMDLTHVIDTSGAYIPGHTTSTVILLGRNRKPVGDTIRAVLGIKGEPTPPDDPANGVVWRSIVRQIDVAAAQDEYTSTGNIPRSTFSHHPWSIGGGGAADLKDRFETTCSRTLRTLIAEIGFGAVTREDEVYLISKEVARRHGIYQTRPLVSGDEVRDWAIPNPMHALFPYDAEKLKPVATPETEKFLWPWKTQLSVRVAYGSSQLQRGLNWFEYSMLFSHRFRSPLSIVFAFVATHNHFVLDRGGRVFKQSAPIIKLSHTATEDDHCALLGLLNSSTACFWMKQVMNCKGLGGQGGGIKPEHWSRPYEYAATQMEQYPIPEGYAAAAPIAKEIDKVAQFSVALLPDAIIEQGIDGLVDRLKAARPEFEMARRRMVWLQEELDWKVYSLYGLCNDTTSDMPDGEALHPEDRPVERLLKNRLLSGEKSIYYEVHAYRGTGPRLMPPTKRTEQIIQQRLAIIEKSPEIRMLEQLDFKRRWQTEPWEQQERRALRNWLLDRLESNRYWPDANRHQPALQSTAQLADKASADPDFLQVAALFRGRPDFDVSALVAELVESESVPFLPVLRYKPSGLRKRAVWEQTWELQRQEDAGKDVGEIPIPPKYASTDFQKADYWRLRGKLDVPKERWISYPHCSTDSDPTLVVGWAGWNHLQQATALVAYYDARKREGWDVKRLTPLLAGLDQLLPWIHQWHPEIDPEFGETAGQSFQTMLEHDAHELGLTLDEIRNWQPPTTTARRRRTRK